jgi:VanZ family protein
MLQNKFVVWYLPAILWGLVILTLTSLPKLTPPPLGFKAQDKVYHLLVYAIFAFLWLRAGVKDQPDYPRLVLWRCVLYVALFGILDELHQLFIPGRQADVLDAAADISGVLLGVFMYKVILNMILKRKSARQAQEIKKR